MTASALTRPGERDRLSVKIAQIDWNLVGLLCIIAGAGTAMLYSIAGGSWQPWAMDHITRFGALLVFMLGLALVMPWLGHASWHAYRDLVDSSGLPERQPRTEEPGMGHEQDKAIGS